MNAVVKVGGLTESVNVEAKAQVLTPTAPSSSETIGNAPSSICRSAAANVWSSQHDAGVLVDEQRYRLELQRRGAAGDSEQSVARRA